MDALRPPLESGVVVLHRSGGAVHYPARFQLVLAANPCACGKRALRLRLRLPVTKRRHELRLSGPLMDRIDLKVTVEPVAHSDLLEVAGERASTAEVAARVASARSAAIERWRGNPWRVNADVPGVELRSSRWRLSTAAIRPAQGYLQQGSLSARGFDRVLRLSWTLADLAGRPAPTADDVNEALFFRTGGAGAWAA